MPIPTISSITPGGGPTGGATLCTVVGTNFRLPSAPSPYGVTTPFPPSVAVRFGGAAGLEVMVLSSTQLLVVSPIHDLGLVDLVVQNLDDDGVAIPGELATKVGAYTYARPVLIDPNGSGVTYMTRIVMMELIRQLIPEVVLTTSVDWDDDPSDGLNITAIAKFPSLVLSGPALRENRFYSTNVQREKAAPGNTFITQRPSYTVDLVYQLLGTSNKSIELTNLLHVTHMFFQRNKYLYVQSVSNDPASPVYRFELDIDVGGEFQTVSVPNSSDVRAFKGAFLIRGFDMDDPDMVFSKGGVVGDGGVSIDGVELQQIGLSFPTGPSPRS